MYQLPPLPSVDALPDRPGMLPAHRRRDLGAGRRRLTALAARRRPLWLASGVVLLLCGVALAAASADAYLRDGRIARDGVEVSATVTRLEMSDDDGVAEYEMTYTYAIPDGRTAAGLSTPSLEASRSLSVGDPVPVVYDPARPTVSVLLDDLGEAGDAPWIAALLATAGALFAGGWLLWALLVRLPERWHRLMSEGRAVEGTVTRVDVGDRATSRARLHYRYTDGQGAARDGVTGWVPKASVVGWQPGDPGLVRHDADGSVWLGRGTLTFYR